MRKRCVRYAGERCGREMGRDSGGRCVCGREAHRLQLLLLPDVLQHHLRVRQQLRHPPGPPQHARSVRPLQHCLPSTPPPFNTASLQHCLPSTPPPRVATAPSNIHPPPCMAAVPKARAAMGWKHFVTHPLSLSPSCLPAVLDAPKP
eukprot:7843030-Pyramimonas_sp.AAC.2